MNGKEIESVFRCKTTRLQRRVDGTTTADRDSHRDTEARREDPAEDRMGEGGYIPRLKSEEFVSA